MIEVSFTMFLQWINFGMLVFLLTFFLYRPLIRVLDKRRETIASRLRDAESQKRSAEDLAREYAKRLDNLKFEGRKIIDEARREAKEEKDRMLALAGREAKLIVENAQLEIEAHARTVRDEIKKESAGLVIECTRRLLGREIREEDHERYIEEFIAGKS